MCSVSTIVYVRHTRMWTFCWTSFEIYSKSEKRREYIQLIKRVLYFFSNSFCTHATDSEKCIDKLWYRKECYIYILCKRGDVGGRSRSSSRTTPTISMPPDSRQILAVCTSLMLGPTRRRWAVYTGVGSKWRWWALHVGVESYTMALGYTCGCWAVHAGVWLETEVLGRTRRCLARNGGVEPYTLALGSRYRCWSYTLAFGSKRRCWIVHAGVGPYTVALGCTRQRFLRGA
jgi:hypothetical protein